jgi:hypothetical protein
MTQKSLTLRIPEETHRKLKLIAAYYDVSMTDVIVHLVELQNIKLEEPDIEGYEYMQEKARGMRAKAHSSKKKGGKR